MCDYSLHLVASRPAKVGDKLVSTSFPRTTTRGFANVRPCCNCQQVRVLRWTSRNSTIRSPCSRLLPHAWLPEWPGTAVPSFGPQI
jgi:hypothetical protein